MQRVPMPAFTADAKSKIVAAAIDSCRRRMRFWRADETSPLFSVAALDGQFSSPGEIKAQAEREIMEAVKDEELIEAEVNIYWPLSTSSGSYTLWIYYPRLTSQTLYTAVNDFIEPKLKHVGDEMAALRNKSSARTRDEEKQFETLQGFELEMIQLRDTLLKLASSYRPNHEDGVQVTAAPLWPLFRHKPWQKVLKDTWTKMEKGECDWANLAMSYWPGRVQERCIADRSLAIAHELEALYVESKVGSKKLRGAKRTAGACIVGLWLAHQLDRIRKAFHAPFLAGDVENMG